MLDEASFERIHTGTRDEASASAAAQRWEPARRERARGPAALA